MCLAGLMGNGPGPILSGWELGEVLDESGSGQAPCVCYTVPSSEQVWAVGIAKKTKAWMMSELSKDGYREGRELGFQVKSVGSQSSRFSTLGRRWLSAALKAGRAAVRMKASQTRELPEPQSFLL